MSRGTKESSSQDSLLGEIERLSGVVQTLESELERMHRLATLGTLAGSIAHEFNNILTPVLSYAQLAQSSPGDRELTAKALQKAVAGTERAAHVAASMLGYVREGNADSANVQQAVEDAVGCIAPPPDRDGIDIATSIDADCRVLISPTALTQILLNLLLNAINATRPHAGTIRVLFESPDGSTGNTSPSIDSDQDHPDSEPELFGELIVEDSGPGIPESIRSTLFEPFVRGAERRRDSGEGTGLGLAICQRLITDAGGEIGITEAQGGGARFILRLPMASRSGSTMRHAA